MVWRPIGRFLFESWPVGIDEQRFRFIEKRGTNVSIGAEFKEFAMKGNVVDLAVGVIVGAAFGKIVSSLVGNVVMPVLGKLIGGFNFSDLAFSLGTDPTGKAVAVTYGVFLQSIFDFVIIALVLFMAI